jgi:competence protein ComEC
LLAAALAFCIGDAVAHPAAAWRPAVMLSVCVLTLATLALYATRAQLRIALLPALALWVAVGFWSAEMQPAPSPQAELAHYADGLQRMVRGHIVRVRELPAQERELSAEDGGRSALAIDLVVDAVEEITPEVSRMVPLSGGIRVTLPGDSASPTFRCGDAVEATLRLRTPERYRDPGAWQYADYLAAQGIGATATLPATHLLKTTNDHRAGTLRCGLFAAQRWASGRLMAYVDSRANAQLPKALRLSADDAGMLNAMLFGDRDRLSHALRLGFERTGSFHLFVVSGMHVALLAGAFFYLCRRLRLPQVSATSCTILITALYALLTGFGAPVQRALLMSSIFLIARLLNRDRSVMNSLGAAALAVLVLSPSALFEASFQMTFLVIVAIGGIAIPLGEWSFLPYARPRGISIICGSTWACIRD